MDAKLETPATESPAVSPAPAPAIVNDDPPPFGVASQSLSWADDPEARLTFVLRPHSAYVLGISRGRTLSGTRILQAFQGMVGERRIKVIGVDFLTIGFWEKMVERRLVHDWSMEDPRMLL
jgi:hypothetical protein